MNFWKVLLVFLELVVITNIVLANTTTSTDLSADLINGTTEIDEGPRNLINPNISTEALKEILERSDQYGEEERMIDFWPIMQTRLSDFMTTPTTTTTTTVKPLKFKVVPDHFNKYGIVEVDSDDIPENRNISNYNLGKHIPRPPVEYWYAESGKNPLPERTKKVPLYWPMTQDELNEKKRFYEKLGGPANNVFPIKDDGRFETYLKAIERTDLQLNKPNNKENFWEVHQSLRHKYLDGEEPPRPTLPPLPPLVVVEDDEFFPEIDHKSDGYFQYLMNKFYVSSWKDQMRIRNAFLKHIHYLSQNDTQSFPKVYNFINYINSVNPNIFNSRVPYVRPPIAKSPYEKVDPQIIEYEPFKADKYEF